MRRALLVLAILLSATAVMAGSPSGGSGGGGAPRIVPWTDPVDGILWRGDQFHPASAWPSQDGSFAHDGEYLVEGVRWGFVRDTPGEGPWRATTGRTRVRLADVERVVLVLNPFATKSVHSAFLFEFSSEDAVVNEETGATTRGLLLSVEGRVEAGQSYSAARGFFGGYPLVYDLATWEDYQQQVCNIYGTGLELYVLDLDAEEVLRTTRLTLEQTLRDHRAERYHLTRRNCTTILVDLLIEGIERRFTEGGWDRAAFKRKLLGGLIVHPGMSFAQPLVRILYRRGLISERLDDIPPAPVP